MKKYKKLLFICQYFYPETLSSAVLPYELATMFFENGYTVSALVGYPNEYLKTDYNVPKKQNVNGINVQRLKYTGVDRHSKLGRIANIFSFSIAVMTRFHKIKKADVLLCTTNPPLVPFVAAVYAKLFRKKLIVTIYDLYPDVPVKLGYLRENSKVALVFNKLYQTVFRNCYKVVVLSTEMKEYLLINKKIEADKIEVIPNWYKDCHSLLDYKYDLPLKVFYGGNMGEAQEIDTILDAIRALKNDDRFRFYFVGQGSQKEKIESYINKEQLSNCSLYDFLEKEKYDEMIEDASLTVLSLKQEIWGLGSPSKFYGYIAAKKPVVAIVPEDTDVARDVREYDAGKYVPIGDSEEFVVFLKQCADNPERLRRMSENAYRLFKDKYVINESYRRYQKLVED